MFRSRDLDGPSKTDNQLSLASCAKFCQGYKYLGLQDGYQKSFLYENKENLQD